jgi:hypothetical protein
VIRRYCNTRLSRDDTHILPSMCTYSVDAELLSLLFCLRFCAGSDEQRPGRMADSLLSMLWWSGGAEALDYCSRCMRRITETLRTVCVRGRDSHPAPPQSVECYPNTQPLGELLYRCGFITSSVQLHRLKNREKVQEWRPLGCYAMWLL